MRRTFPSLPPPLHDLFARDVLARIAPRKCIKLRGTIKKNVFFGTMTASDDAAATAVDDDAGAAAGAASESGGGGEKAVVVKLCRHYGVAVHEAVHAAGYAPKLHHHKQIGDWIAVVMDLLDRNEWVACDGGERTTAAVAAAYKQAFVRGEQRFVHGDTRPPNVFVSKRVAAFAPTSLSTSSSAKTESKNVQFIDFELAGQEGEVAYPPYVSRSEFASVIDLVARTAPMRRADVQLGGLVIKQQYDLALILGAGEPVVLCGRARACQRAALRRV